MEREEVLLLSPMQLDALREIGNIGAGNAATALSQIISRKIDMSVPRLNILPLSEVPEVVGGPDVMVAGVYLRVFGPAPGSILFLLPKDSAFALVDMSMGRQRGTTHLLCPMDESALMEIGNILAGSFLNALSYFTKMTLLPSLPALAVDMAGAILSAILIQLGRVGDHALLIDTEFSTEANDVRGHFFLIPDPGSLNVILGTLGVSE